MSSGERHQSEWGAAALLTLTATAVLLLASPDSYLHDLYNRVDSAWFYLCGKAWFSGMTPYVDFTDSKGPLLWLIYGLGYLMSPRDYTGVYWLSCLGFAVALWFVYRSACLVLPSRRLALLVALLMPLAYCYPHIHEEVKTEHFAQPLIALCLYATLLLRLGTNLRPATPPRALAAIGAAMGCVLMMKYSFVPMLGVFALFALLAARRHGCGVGRSVMWLTAGGVAAVLPWLVWMLAVGNLRAFVDQYFVATLGTLGGLRQQYGSVFDLVRKFFLFPTVTVFPVLCLAGAALYWRTVERGRQGWLERSFPLVATVWFFVFTFPNAWWIYYYEICTWTLFFGLMAVVAWLGRRWRPGRLALAGVAGAVVVAAGAWSVLLVPANFCTVTHPARDTYYRYAWLMGQVERPTVMYWDIYSCGFETPVEGLPGTLYWAGQNGATPAMRASQEEAVRQGKVDFVFVADTLHDARLRQWGYHKWDYSRRDAIEGCDDLLYTLYTRHRLQAPPPDFAPPAAIDIVAKRWPGRRR